MQDEVRMPDDREPNRETERTVRESPVNPDINAVRVSWEIVSGHIILQAGCKRGIFHSYEDALVGLIAWAAELLKKGIERELERQLESTIPT